MAEVFGVYGSHFPRFGRLAKNLLYRVLIWIGRRRNFINSADPMTAKISESFKGRYEAGESIFLMGCGLGGHNSGIALIRCSKKNGIEIIANNEEEKFSGVKHSMEFPQLAIEETRRLMVREKINISDIHAFLGTWDYASIMALSLSDVMAELPKSWSWLKPGVRSGLNDSRPMLKALFNGSWMLQTAFKTKSLPTVIGINHHDAHASYAFAASPFSQLGKDCMIAVFDGNGGTGAISLYTVKNHQITLYSENDSFFDSLGQLYAVISSTQGGWTPLSSEGRYMGAAAWGDKSRLSNPFYMSLRQILYFGPEGELRLNRKMANWHLKGFIEPYTERLIRILGTPVKIESMWNPDAIMKVEDIVHSRESQERFDKAAALQLVFEDGLTHVIGNFIRKTGLQYLVLTGGCALNCIANLRLLQQFDKEFYHHHLGQTDQYLRLWVPPAPGDAGVTIGAAISFTRQSGMKPIIASKHGYECGCAATSESIREAGRQLDGIGWIKKGELLGESFLDFGINELADLMAFLISKELVIGIFQGRAETGPRALGHRSILANPCHLRTIKQLNSKVKFREQLRPLAPMMTLKAAKRFYHLELGALDANASAYEHMVLAAIAKEEAKHDLPAIIHQDGTSRIQIVKKESNPLVHLFLEALGRHIGVEVSVNTSLNVGSPIAQNPTQALKTLRRSQGIDGLFFVDDLGEIHAAYDEKTTGNKDGGSHLKSELMNWHLQRTTKREKETHAPTMMT